jgi:erythromycin esterase
MKNLYIAGLLFVLNAFTATGQTSSEWDKWVKTNSYGLSLSDTNNYQDLTFLKGILKDKKIVFLGENSHGVSEFTTLKSRMIRFLHDSLGFDVLAFESNLGDAYYANAKITTADNQTSIYNALSPLWHVEEIVPLFGYIRQTHKTSNPLTLSGVDFQASNGSFTFSHFLYDLISPISLNYAKEALAIDSFFTRACVRGWTMFRLLSKEEIITGYKRKDEILAFYSNLQDYLNQNESKFNEDQKPDLKLAKHCVQDRIDCVHHAFRDSAYMANKLSECTDVRSMTVRKLWDKYRDYRMAENLKFLYSYLYQGRKIIVWAQNSHIYKRKCHLADTKEVYTIALQSYSGKGSYVISKASMKSEPTREVYKFKTPTDNLSLERIMHSAGHKVSFVDMLHQDKSAGNSWMFEKSKYTDWAGDELDEIENVRSKWDAFILVDKISPPHYLTIDYEYLK